MKFTLLFWSIFVVNLIYGIVCVTILPFKSPEKKTGFMMSVMLLYTVPYWILVLFISFTVANFKKRLNQQLISSKFIVEKIFSYWILVIAGFSFFSLIINTFPKAFATNNYMGWNSISMSLGFLFGGIRCWFTIQSGFKLNQK
jgi:hypothetical protein